MAIVSRTPKTRRQTDSCNTPALWVVLIVAPCIVVAVDRSSVEVVRDCRSIDIVAAVQLLGLLDIVLGHIEAQAVKARLRFHRAGSSRTERCQWIR